MSRCVRGAAIGLTFLLAVQGMATAEDAATLIREGIERRRSGDDAGALKLFEAAYRAEPTPRALAQVGMAEQALGRWVSADEHLERALDARTDSWIIKNREPIKQALERVRDHVGAIEILDGPSGAEVRLDGVRRGVLPLTAPLSTTIGPVTVQLTAPGFLPIERTTAIRARETTRESFYGIAPPPLASSAPAAPATKVPSPSHSIAVAEPVDPVAAPGLDRPAADVRPQPVDGEATHEGSRLPWILGAGGLAVGALVFGVVEQVRWQHKVDSFGSMPGCGAGEVDRGGVGCQSLYEDGHEARTLAFIGYGAAAALAAAGAVLYFHLGSSSSSGSGAGQVACNAGPMTIDCGARF